MRIISLVAALVVSSNLVWAEESLLQEHTYKYKLENINEGTNPNTGSIVTVFETKNNTIDLDGVSVNISISGWSDSASMGPNDIYNYDRVVSAEMKKVYDLGWAVLNTEESDGPHQTIDNVKFPDYDFVLLSFSEKVTLDTLKFGWANFSGGSQEVSVAAIGEPGFNKLTSETSTWSSIISNAVSSSFSIERLSGSKGVSNLNFSSAAKYWLVGAYNTVFGSTPHGTKFNDAFKIAGIEFSNTSTKPIDKEPPKQVSEPGALALMCLGLGLVLYRRKHRGL